MGQTSVFSVWTDSVIAALSFSPLNSSSGFHSSTDDRTIFSDCVQKRILSRSSNAAGTHALGAIHKPSETRRRRGHFPAMSSLPVLSGVIGRPQGVHHNLTAHLERLVMNCLALRPPPACDLLQHLHPP